MFMILHIKKEEGRETGKNGRREGRKEGKTILFL